MSRSDRDRLADIADAAVEIGQIVERDQTAYDADVTLRRALERCLEIIGEAAKSLDSTSRDAMPSIPWSDIIRLRDRLSHHYHRIDASQLWTVATSDIPNLLAAVAARLDEPNP